MKTLEDYKKEAITLRKATFETVICWEVSCYDINENFDEGVIELCRTEAEAKKIVKLMKEDGCDVYYKPFVVDNDSYEKVTPENFSYYDKKGDFVKQLKADLYA